MSISRAAVALRALLEPSKDTPTVASVAEDLDVSYQAVAAWLAGRSLPQPKLMAAIEARFAIPMRDWVAPPDAPALDADATGERPAVKAGP